MTEHEDFQTIRAALSGRQRDAFAPGFADRATARWRRELSAGRLGVLELTLATAMNRYFRRIVPIAAAAALLLAFHNVRHRVTGQSMFAALFGPPAVSVLATHASASAYSMASLDELYDLQVLGRGSRE